MLLILGLVVAIGIAVFALVNNAPVSVNLVFWKSQEISLALVILYSALLGALIVWFMGFGEKIKLRWAIRKLESEVRQRAPGAVAGSQKE